MSDMYNKIEKLCQERNIKVGTLAKAINVRNGIFTELKSGRTKKLSTTTLEKVAQYFDVPIDYFLETSKVEQIQDELFLKRKLLFDMSAKATEEDLDKIIKIVDTLIDD